MKSNFSYTIADGSKVTEVDSLPEITDGTIWWNGEQREVRDIHVGLNGTQVELF